ncbi:MAG: DUF72 domain-containing protein [Alphaproteobacteria bacterium]|nr:DUF72 domain-containing protein [Alphaproteobacteria bacterium]
MTGARDLFGVAAAARPSPRARAGDVAPATESPLWSARPLPGEISLGTSSWSFPGWRGLLWDRAYPATALSRSGLAAYATCPLLRTVSLDRTFYAPLSTAEYIRHAEQVPAGFTFLVKAPAAVCDAVLRDEGGRARVPNPHFLDPAIAARELVVPCIEGLGAKAGPIVFQVSPLPAEVLDDVPLLADRFAAFFAALPAEVGGSRPVYALEVRDATLLTPRIMKMLAAAGVRLCLGLHDRMPEAERQIVALRALDGAGADGPYRATGPVIVRWNLHRGFRYQAAKNRYEPFDRLVDEDPTTRDVLARLAVETFRSGQRIWITANNKAEGSAPWTLVRLAEAIHRAGL